MTLPCRLKIRSVRQAGFESRLVPDLPLPFIPTLIGLRAFEIQGIAGWMVWMYLCEYLRCLRRSGLGRAGTFVATWCLLERLRSQEESIDVYGTVKALCRWRPHLVNVPVS